MNWLSGIILLLGAQSFAASSLYVESELVLGLSEKPELKAQIRIPRDRKNQKFPVLLVFGGFQEAARVLDLIHTSQAVILASFDYPFDLPRNFSFPGSLALAPEVKKMIRQTHDGIQLLVSKLMARADVDPERITILGASLGAPFAVEAAAQNPKIKGLVLVHGFGQLAKTAAFQLDRSFSKKFGVLGSSLAWLLAHLANFYISPSAPEKSAERLHENQRVLFIAAEKDTFVPRVAIERLWEGVQKSRAISKRVDTHGDHLQPGSEKLIDALVEMITQWMKSAELLR